MPRAVAIVPHTHWDREWYRPFEGFRSRLVAVLDEVLDTLETDDRWEGFHLDGQVAAIEDYLDARPEARDRVRKLVAAGRLSIGPWYVLMDEFCVSGETILRNLEMGIESAEHLGGSSRVGYLPDMFGHVTQMPQMLRLAGITDAVVWRGVPSAVRRSTFEWSAPDGSAVRAEYLPVGYASGAFLPDDPVALVRRIDALAEESRQFAGDQDEPLLVMNGTDHQAIQRHLPRTVESANEVQDRYRFELTTIAAYLSLRSVENLQCWQGELRSSARAPILMGVLSNRRDLKVAAASCERALERLGEPTAALWLPPELWPTDTLRRAWLEVVRNSAHDSICGCSTDEVGRAVLHRYDTARTIAGDILESALAIAAVAMRTAGPVAVNPSPRSRAGIVEMTLPGAEPPSGTQQVALVPAGRTERAGTGKDLAAVLGELARDGWLPVGTTPSSARVSLTQGRVELFLGCDVAGAGSPAVAPVIAEAWALAGANADGPLKVTLDREAAQTVLTRVTGVPGFGWSAWTAGALGCAPVEAGPDWIRNSLIAIEVDPSTGMFSVDGHRGFGRLVDEGDAGDSYNYCPPTDDRRVDSPSKVEVDVIERGPLRGRLRVSSVYTWPARIENGARAGAVPIEVVTDLELRAGEGFVRITVSFENRCRDHRVRTVLPLRSPTDTTTSECAFATVERARAEGGPREEGLGTFPSRRFVMAGGLTFVHDGVVEHELVDDGRALAVTVLRSTGVLSKPLLTTRPNAAGPPIPVSGAQMLGPVSFAYAIALGEVDPWALADDFLLPLLVVQGAGTGHLPPRGSRLEVSGAEVSALRRRRGCLEMRVFNPRPETATVHVPGHRGALVDVEGNELGRWDGRFELRAWQIANARLDARSLD